MVMLSTNSSNDFTLAKMLVMKQNVGTVETWCVVLQIL